MYKIQPMSIENAKAISLWTYPDEYSIYSFVNNEDTISELMSCEYFSCGTQEEGLIGYFCFGKSAQIPTHDNYPFDGSALDIGLGLLPDLCGRKNGRLFMQSGMDYAKNILKANKLRLAVADFNKRAISLYSNVGFTKTDEVVHQKSKMKFLIMQCTL